MILTRLAGGGYNSFMKNSNTTVWLLVGLILSGCLLGACGGDEPACGEGQDKVPSIIDDDADLNTFWISRIGVDELNQLRGPDPGHSTLVQAVTTS